MSYFSPIITRELDSENMDYKMRFHNKTNAICTFNIPYSLLVLILYLALLPSKIQKCIGLQIQPVTFAPLNLYALPNDQFLRDSLRLKRSTGKRRKNVKNEIDPQVSTVPKAPDDVEESSLNETDPEFSSVGSKNYRFPNIIFETYESYIDFKKAAFMNRWTTLFQTISNNSNVSSSIRIKDDCHSKDKKGRCNKSVTQRNATTKNMNDTMIDLVFLLDGSSSVGWDNFAQILTFVKTMTKTLPISINLTRVALIIYSSKNKIFRYVDQVTRPKPTFNKCQLVLDLRRVVYSGGGTYTLGALRDAKKIFQYSRPGSRKIIILVTDGYSNLGDPRPLAQFLKRQGIEIFTFGVKDGNHVELRQMASRPWASHHYALESFEDLVSLAQGATSNITQKDILSHTSIPLYTPMTDTNKRMCGCHYSTETSVICGCKNEDALCHCDSIAGDYVCLCKPGTYSNIVNGTKPSDSCIPCPIGTYKDIYGNDLSSCIKCPEHRNSSQGTDSVNKCNCPKNYHSKEGKCEALRCPELTLPTNATFTSGTCDTLVGSACGIVCDPGFKLTQGDNLRICDKQNLTWSGREPRCQMQTCQSLPITTSLKMSCTDRNRKKYDKGLKEFDVGSACVLSCDNDMTLIGKRERTCLPIGIWDGVRTYCRGPKCHTLVPIENGQIHPKSCLQKFSPSKFKCKYTCNQEYILSGSGVNQCQSNGTWSLTDPPACV